MPPRSLTISYPAIPNQLSFRYFKTSPEIIKLAVMLYVKFPLSLRNVEDLLHERGVDVSYEAILYWWHRFGFKFSCKTKKLFFCGKGPLSGPLLGPLGHFGLRACAVMRTTGRGSWFMSTGRGWGRAPTKTKPASQSGGLGMLFYFFAKRGWERWSNFKLNGDVALTE